MRRGSYSIVARDAPSGELGAPQRARLEEASAIELGFPHELLARRPTIHASGGAGNADTRANAS